MAAMHWGVRMHIWFGLMTVNPSVDITASESSGSRSLVSGSRSPENSDVTFKFSLSKRSEDFKIEDVKHNCTRFDFLGMKSTYYLTCSYSKGLQISVHVKENSFTDVKSGEPNTRSEQFLVSMS